MLAPQLVAPVVTCPRPCSGRPLILETHSCAEGVGALRREAQTPPVRCHGEHLPF